MIPLVRLIVTSMERSIFVSRIDFTSKGLREPDLFAEL